jgi:hypothetical protein
MIALTLRPGIRPSRYSGRLSTPLAGADRVPPNQPLPAFHRRSSCRRADPLPGGLFRGSIDLPRRRPLRPVSGLLRKCRCHFSTESSSGPTGCHKTIAEIAPRPQFSGLCDYRKKGIVKIASRFLGPLGGGKRDAKIRTRSMRHPGARRVCRRRDGSGAIPPRSPP